jgi:hypothetical protein
VGASALTGAVSRAKPPGDSDQPGFWDENFNPLVENERDRRLDELVQELQRRFGDRMVKRGFN